MTRDDVRALAPDVGPERLDVRDHDGHVRFATDADGLAHGAEQADGVGALVTHVGVVDAAVLRGDLRQLDHFFRGGVAARRVVEAGGDADGAFLHGGVDEALHLRSIWSAVGLASDMPMTSPRTVPCPMKSAALVPMPCRSHFVKRGADVAWAVTVVSGGDRGDALHEVGVVAAALRIGEIRRGVGVGIDEARRDDQARCIDFAFSVSCHRCCPRRRCGRQ